MTNTLGEIYVNTEMGNNGMIDISFFPAGVYQILIKFDNGNTIVKQFVKQ